MTDIDPSSTPSVSSSEPQAVDTPVKSHSLLACFAAAVGVFLGIWLIPFGALAAGYASVVLDHPRVPVAALIATFLFCWCVGSNAKASDRVKLSLVVLEVMCLVTLFVSLLVFMTYYDRTPHKQDYTRLMNTAPENWEPSKVSGSLSARLHHSGAVTVRTNRQDCLEMVDWNVKSNYYQITINGSSLIVPASCNRGLNTWKWVVIEPVSPVVPQG